jgi:hypothetical protein
VVGGAVVGGAVVGGAVVGAGVAVVGAGIVVVNALIEITSSVGRSVEPTTTPPADWSAATITGMVVKYTSSPLFVSMSLHGMKLADCTVVHFLQ